MATNQSPSSDGLHLHTATFLPVLSPVPVEPYGQFLPAKQAFLRQKGATKPCAVVLSLIATGVENKVCNTTSLPFI